MTYFTQHRLCGPLILLLCFALASCATSPHLIAPVASPTSVAHLPCAELNSNLVTARAYLNELTGVQKANRQRDATGIGVGIAITPIIVFGFVVIFMSTLLLWPFNHPQDPDVHGELLIGMGEVAGDIYPRIGRHQYTETIAQLKGTVLTLETVHRHKKCPQPVYGETTGVLKPSASSETASGRGE